VLGEKLLALVFEEIQGAGAYPTQRGPQTGCLP
jgi:hypothetical protein